MIYTKQQIANEIKHIRNHLKSIENKVAEIEHNNNDDDNNYDGYRNKVMLDCFIKEYKKLCKSYGLMVSSITRITPPLLLYQELCVTEFKEEVVDALTADSKIKI